MTERWHDETFGGAQRFGLAIERTIFRDRSEYQTVEVVDTPAFGRVLILDGVFMTSERDEHYYHEMLVHPALTVAESPERVLIVGGGDGGTAREVLRHPSVREVVMVELDALVVEACRAHLAALGGDAWDDPRLDLRIGDGAAYVHETDDAPFDVVLLDGTDPIGPGAVLFGEDFFAGVKRVLAPGGVFAMQSESPFLFPREFADVQSRLRTRYERVRPCFGPKPLYAAGYWSWTLASDARDPLAPDPARVHAIAEGCRYYDLDIHHAAFVQPREVRDLIARA